MFISKSLERLILGIGTLFGNFGSEGLVESKSLQVS